MIGWIVFGLVVGALAKLLMPVKDPGGIFVTFALGVVGAMVGGRPGRAIGLYEPGRPAGIFMAVVGAAILLALYRLLRRKRAT